MNSQLRRARFPRRGNVVTFRTRAGHVSFSVAPRQSGLLRWQPATSLWAKDNTVLRCPDDLVHEPPCSAPSPPSGERAVEH